MPIIFFPDGIAATRLAGESNIPLVITARGSDINLIPEYAKPRAMIQSSVKDAAHLITVSAALRARLLDLGARPEKVTVLRNGVDLDFFRPADNRADVRSRLGSDDRPLLLSVGNLVDLKGHHLIIEAMQLLAGMQLVIIGAGPMASELGELVRRFGLQDRVTLTGRLSPEALLPYLQAADALILASSREGWANVLLEAMACGTPVVATRVGGTPELVTAPEAGVLMHERSADGIAGAVQCLLGSSVKREQTRAFAESFSWDDTSQGQIEIFKRAIAEHRREGQC